MLRTLAVKSIVSRHALAGVNDTALYTRATILTRDAIAPARLAGCSACVWGNGQAEMREKSTGLDYHFITEPIRRRR